MLDALTKIQTKMGSHSRSDINHGNTTMLEAKGLGKSFGATVALKDLSLFVEQGEVLALLGESGSGKTTLLRIIAGFEAPSAGKLFVQGAEIASNKLLIPPEKREVGMVFQDYALFPHLTVAQNIQFGLQSLLNKEEKEARVRETLHLVGLVNMEKRYPHELSGGQQQRVAIARALAPKPKLLLLDEPFSNLDESLKAQVRKEVKDLLKQLGITAVFVTHDTKDALATADRIAMLRNGELQQQGSPMELYSQPANQYVASYFSPVNWLDRQWASKQKGAIGMENADGFSLGIRPAHIAPAEAFSQPDIFTFEAEMKSIAFLGDYWEVLLQAEGQEDILVWLSYQPNTQIEEVSTWACQMKNIIQIVD